jgi:chromosome segregation ATPase
VPTNFVKKDVDESEELLAMKGELDETKSRLSVEVATREALQFEAAELRARVAALEAAEAKSAHTIATLQGSVETLMADKASWEQQVIAKTSHMTTQLQTAQNEAEETVKAFNALHERYEQMKKIHAVAAKNETIMKQAIIKLQKDIQTATTAKETAEQRLAEASKGVSEELVKVQREKILGESALHARIVRMEVQLETTAQELVIRSAQVEALQRICDELCEAAINA